MCANDVQCNTAADDVWDSDSDHEQPARSPTRGTQLDREWEARKQQFYNVSHHLRQWFDQHELACSHRILTSPPPSAPPAAAFNHPDM
jgi:hypothetical protein